MDNIIEIYKDQLLIEKERFLEISEKMAPLEQEKIRTEKNIKALEQLIGSNKETKQTIISEKEGSLSNKIPMEAYKELGRDYFKSESFKEPKIRETATKEGLKVNGKPISGSYSRAVITRLIENGTFEKVTKGLYRYRQQEEKRTEEFGLS